MPVDIHPSGKAPGIGTGDGGGTIKGFCKVPLQELGAWPITVGRSFENLRI